MITQKKETGFTIIEVVLVLAIAALIFLMVFIALPAMRQGQRDDGRKRDLSLIATAVTNYTSANRGKFPDTDNLRATIGELSGNIEKNNVTIEGFRGSGTVTKGVLDSHALVVTGAKCEEGGNSVANSKIIKGSARSSVVITKLEQGGGMHFCLDS